ncbi:SusC/RagA family TonB-linked outer membrane protein [Adhaeribacter aquaticus]|uniref:SusC/RagA family TonB-linked outer membrane protein n=1 Tax=Adhaeribacter aquaticus TaxID=299567 RepID=UPI003CCC3262
MVCAFNASAEATIIKTRDLKTNNAYGTNLHAESLINWHITGKVVSNKGEALPGVTVLVKGTTNGTTTGADGTYSLSVPEQPGTLVFTYIGFTSKEVAYRGPGAQNVSLADDSQALQELVVVGYGVQEKKDVVGAVGVASRKDFGDVAVSNTSQLIQGKVSGVQVVNNSGLPGSGSRIIVRGAGSFTSTTPLYVIDGIQSDQSTFNSLSPYDIQDITVLKDASSVAIYGAQGANGVVIVTTRTAKTGAPKVTYNGYVGVSKAWRQLDLLDAPQYVDFVKEFAANTNTALPAKLNTPDVLQTRTDWQKEMFRTAKVTEHHVGLNGGTENVKYGISTGYTSQESSVIGLKFQRFNVRVNLQENVGRRIRFGQQVNVRYSVTQGVTPSFVAGLRMPPYSPIYDPANLGGFAVVTTVTDLNDAQNPLVEPSLRDRRDRNYTTYGQFFGELDIVEGLKFRSQLGIGVHFSQDYNFNPIYQNAQLTFPSSVNEGYSYRVNPIIENYFTYNKKVGDHSFVLTAGNSYRSTGLFRSVALRGENLPNDEIHQIGMTATPTLTSAQANSQPAFNSYFARINYTLKDKYIFSATARRDASSVFGPKNRVGYFPSVGVGYRLSEEEFMKGVPFLSDLKLRASWGRTGNANIPPYVYMPLVWKGNQNSNNVVYSLGPDEGLVQGSTLAVPYNPNLKWEETTTTDFGVDAAFLSNKLTFSLGYYNRNSKDLLVNVPLPTSAGYGGTQGTQSAILTNAASAYNRGVELQAAYNNNVGELTYGLSVNGAYNKNQVTSLGDIIKSPILSGGYQAVASWTRTEPGSPIGAFYGFVVDHVAIDQADVDKYNAMAVSKGVPGGTYQASLRPGDIIFKDLNGDGQVTNADQKYIGNPNPKWNYGANLNLGFKGFDLMASLQGVAGVDIVNALGYWTEGMTRPFNSTTEILRRWKKPGDVTDVPRAGQNITGSLNLRPSTRFVQSGSFARLRNLTLGYTIPEARIKPLTANTISSLRVYFTAQNLFTITKYKGYDPEISGSNTDTEGDFIFTRGIDIGQYPQPRTFMLGFQVGF